MIDIVICSVPGIFTQTPSLAPATLKACAISAGFTAQGIDLNIEVINKINKSNNRQALEAFIKQQEINSSAVEEIGDLIEYCVERILETKANILGLCLLTQDNQFFATWLCYHLRFVKPDLKIVIGGSGIKNFIAESKIGFAELLKARGLIDDYINGDGEYSLVEYLKGNYEYPGINSSTWQPIIDLNQLPYSDFGDYDFTQYGDPGIPICDSRGCVRTCEFCDVIEHWKKYQYRTSDNIFNEMLQQVQRHGIRKFLFYNSLTNGNMKEFQKLLDLICDYNHTHPDQQLSWEGYFIVRSQQQHPEELWNKIKLSNGFLQLGIESVVEKVRVSLGKKFTNQDIDYHLAMAKKYSVPVLLLLIVGYPTETKQDFVFTKSWFQERKHYFTQPVQGVVLSLAAILPNTKLDKRQSEYGIVKGTIPTIWINVETQLSTEDRVSHYNDLLGIIKSYGVGTCAGNDSLEAAKKELLS